MGGKIKNILFALVLALGLLAGAGASYTDISFVSDKDEVVQGSQVSFLFLGQAGSELRVDFFSPSGREISADFVLGEDSGLWEGQVKAEELGSYQSSMVWIDGDQVPYEKIGFQVVEDIGEIYHELDENSVAIDDQMSSQVKNEDLVQALSKVSFFDESGQALSVSVKLTKGDQAYYYQLDKEAFLTDVSVLTSDQVEPGTYTGYFKAGPTTYEKEIQVLADSEGGASLSGNISSNLTRLHGENRTQTVAKISQAVYPKADWAVLTDGDDFNSNLASVSLAAAVEGPLLFVGKDNITDTTENELKRLGVSKVYLVGKETFVNQALVAKLNSMGLDVYIISGAGPIEIADKVASELGKYHDFDKAILADVSKYPDALAASALATKEGLPVLFTQTEDISSRTLSNMQKLGVQEVIIVGGPKSVSDQAISSLNARAIPATRVAGANRYETAVKFAETYFADSQSLIIASGQIWSDAIAGGLLAKKVDAPIILSDKDDLPDSSLATVNKYKGKEVYVLGGTHSISNNLYTKMAGYISNIADSQPKEDNKADQPKPAEPDQTVDRSKRPIRIFLDQGHGWNYNKGVVEGYYEGNAMYWYGLILRNNLREYGFEVDCIRNDLEAERRYCIENGLAMTNGLGVAQRGPLADGYDLLLSLHTNAHSNPNVNGTEVFDSCQRTNYEFAKELCDMIVDHFGHNNRGVKYRYYDDGSVVYGAISQDQLGTDWYGILRTSTTPIAFMLEHGFHTNYADCTKLMNAEFKHQMAKKTAKIVADYYGYSK